MVAGLVLLHAGALAAPFTFSWPALWLCLSLFFLSVLGVTLGYHRLLTHKSFECPKFFEYFFVVLANLSSEGDPISWVSTHRYHHMHSDTEEDCHSPRHGFWWSHMLWFVFRSAVIDGKDFDQRYAPDLVKDRFYIFLKKYSWCGQWALGILLLAWGGWSFVVWGIFVRTLLVLHVTWFINSAAHRWGYQTYPTSDNSRNLWWLGILGLGEGWHNNHHAFQSSAAHGLKWWEVDLTYWVIRFFSIFGLTYNIRKASASTGEIK